jgi:tetratricopeptide (TPR) repeat protein
VLKSIWDPRFIIGILFLILTLIIVFLTSSSKKTSPIAFGLLWFLFSLVPSSSVIPLAEVTNDHRMFYPFVGLVLSVSWAIALLVIKYENRFAGATWQKAIMIFGIIFILTGHGYGTYRRNEGWRTDESLCYDVSIKSPNNGRGLMNYGLSQMSKGRFEIALSYYKMALNTDYRNHPYLAINLGVVHEAMNMPEEAGTFFEKSIRIGSSYPECHFYFANWLQKNNRSVKAMKHLKTALDLSPGHYRAQQLLDSIERKAMNEVQTAEALVETYPTPKNLLNLSLKYFNNGEFEKCIEICEEALIQNPDFYQAYNNIGSAYIAMQHWDEGIVACKKALLINPDYELAKNNLRWVILQKEKSGH